MLLYSSKTSRRVANVALSTEALTVPDRLTRRDLSIVRIWSSKISPCLPECRTAMRNGAVWLPVVMGATIAVRR